MRKKRWVVLLFAAVVLVVATVALYMLPQAQQGPQFAFLKGLKRKFDQDGQASRHGGSLQHIVRREYIYKLPGQFRDLERLVEVEMISNGYTREKTGNPNSSIWMLRRVKYGGGLDLTAVSLSSEYDLWLIHNPTGHGAAGTKIPKDSYVLTITELKTASQWDRFVTWIDDLDE